MPSYCFSASSLPALSLNSFKNIADRPVSTARFAKPASSSSQASRSPFPPRLSSCWCDLPRGRGFPTSTNLLNGPPNIPRHILPQVIGFIIELVLLAVGFAWIADRVLRLRHPPHAVIRNNPTWFEMIDGQVCPEDTKAVIVSAELKNGASIQGAVKAHEPGKDQALARLVLRPHSGIKFGIRHPDGTFVDVPPGWPTPSSLEMTFAQPTSPTSNPRLSPEVCHSRGIGIGEIDCCTTKTTNIRDFTGNPPYSIRRIPSQRSPSTALK